MCSSPILTATGHPARTSSLVRFQRAILRVTLVCAVASGVAGGALAGSVTVGSSSLSEPVRSVELDEASHFAHVDAAAPFVAACEPFLAEGRAPS